MSNNKQSKLINNENQARKEFFDSLKINNGGHQI